MGKNVEYLLVRVDDVIETVVVCAAACGGCCWGSSTTTASLVYKWTKTTHIDSQTDTDRQTGKQRLPRTNQSNLGPVVGRRLSSPPLIYPPSIYSQRPVTGSQRRKQRSASMYSLSLSPFVSLDHPQSAHSALRRPLS